MNTRVFDESSRGETDRRAETSRMEKLLGMIREIIGRKNERYAHDTTPLYYTASEKRLATSFGGKYRT